METVMRDKTREEMIATPEPELTLPKWINEDPEAGAKGKLLYVEEWALRGRYQEFFLFGISILLMAIGVSSYVVGISLVVLDFSMNNIIGAIIIVIMSSIPAFMGWLGYSDQRRCRPFCIYEKGYTVHYVPQEEANLQQERFIPWAEVERVELETESIATGITEHNFKIVQTNDDYIVVNNYILSDPLFVLRFMRSVIPEKMDDKMSSSFLEDPPFRKDNSDKIFFSVFGAFIIHFVLFFPAYINAISSSHIQDLIFNSFDFKTFILVVFTQLAALSFWYLIVGHKDLEQQIGLIKYRAKFNEAGIKITRTVIGRCTKNVQALIPWQNISVVRLKLDPQYYSQEAEIELSSSERFRIPISIYEQMGSVQEYEKRGTDYFRKDPIVLSEPIIRWNKLKLLLFSLPFWLPIMMNFGQDETSLIFLTFIILFIVGLISAAIVESIRISKWNKG